MVESILPKLLSHLDIFKNNQSNQFFGVNVNLFIFLVDGNKQKPNQNDFLGKCYIIKRQNNGYLHEELIDSYSKLNTFEGYNFAIGYKYYFGEGEQYTNAYTFTISWINITKTKEILAYGCLKIPSSSVVKSNNEFSTDIGKCIRILPLLLEGENKGYKSLFHWVFVKFSIPKLHKVTIGSEYYPKLNEFNSITNEKEITIDAKYFKNNTDKIFSFLGITYPFLVMFSNNTLRLSRLNPLRLIKGYSSSILQNDQDYQLFDLSTKNLSNLFEGDIHNFTNVLQGEWIKDNPEIIPKINEQRTKDRFVTRLPSYYPITFFDFYFSEMTKSSSFHNQRMIPRISNFLLDNKQHTKEIKMNILSLDEEDKKYILSKVDNVDLSMVEFCEINSSYQGDYDIHVTEPIKIPLDYFTKCQPEKIKNLHSIFLKFFQNGGINGYSAYSMMTDTIKNSKYMNDLSNILFEPVDIDDNDKLRQFKQIYSKGNRDNNNSENSNEIYGEMENLTQPKDTFSFVFVDENRSDDDTSLGNFSDSDSHNNGDDIDRDDISSSSFTETSDDDDEIESLSKLDEYHYNESLERINNMNKKFFESINSDFYEKNDHLGQDLFDSVFANFRQDESIDDSDDDDDMIYDSSEPDINNQYEYQSSQEYDDTDNNDSDEDDDFKKIENIMSGAKAMGARPRPQRKPKPIPKKPIPKKAKTGTAKPIPKKAKTGTTKPNLKSATPKKKQAQPKSNIQKQSDKKTAPIKTTPVQKPKKKIPKPLPKPPKKQTSVGIVGKPPQKSPKQSQPKKNEKSIPKKTAVKPTTDKKIPKKDINTTKNKTVKKNEVANKDIKKPKTTKKNDTLTKSKNNTQKKKDANVKTKEKPKVSEKKTPVTKKKEDVKKPKDSKKMDEPKKKDASKTKKSDKLGSEKKTKKDTTKVTENKTSPTESNKPEKVKKPKLGNRIIDFSKSNTTTKTSNDTITKNVDKKTSLKFAPSFSLSIGSSTQPSGMMGQMFPSQIQQPVFQQQSTQDEKSEDVEKTDTKQNSDDIKDNVNESDVNSEEKVNVSNTQSSLNSVDILSQIFTLPLMDSDNEDIEHSENDIDERYISVEIPDSNKGDVKNIRNELYESKTLNNEIEDWANSLETTGQMEYDQDKLLYYVQLGNDD